MKPLSEPLYQYLLKSGALRGTKEDIEKAKEEYRKIYKQQWKLKHKPRKEIRIEFTLKQFAAIKNKAIELGIPHTTYSRIAILSAVGANQGMHHKEELLKILQLISMAAIASARRTMPLHQLSALLTKAEQQLLQYLRS